MRILSAGGWRSNCERMKNSVRTIDIVEKWLSETDLVEEDGTKEL